jgi:hypothetical protein
MDYSKIESEIIKAIKESDLIKYFQLDNNVFERPSVAIIKELFVKPVPIDYDRKGIFYLDKGEKIYIPEMAATISLKGEWLSDYLPDINFDIEQSGNVRAAQEAESMYTVSVIANILKDDLYKQEVNEVASSYDFIYMKPLRDTKSFSSLLNEWRSEGVTVGIIISACKFKISNTKKKLRGVFERWSYRS